MRTKVIIAGAVLFALLLFIAFLFIPHRKPPQDVTVRHVKSVVAANITTMTFEIKNHTADPYIFYPIQVQVRKSNDWTGFQKFDMFKIHPIPKLDPQGVASYTVDVTNLPAGSVVQFVIRAQKKLFGVEGFARRAEWDLNRVGGKGIPLNPYDKKTQVFGVSKEVVTEEWLETAK